MPLRRLSKIIVDAFINPYRHLFRTSEHHVFPLCAYYSGLGSRRKKDTSALLELIHPVKTTGVNMWVVRSRLSFTGRLWKLCEIELFCFGWERMPCMPVLPRAPRRPLTVADCRLTEAPVRRVISLDLVGRRHYPRGTTAAVHTSASSPPTAFPTGPLITL